MKQPTPQAPEAHSASERELYVGNVADAGTMESMDIDEDHTFGPEVDVDADQADQPVKAVSAIPTTTKPINENSVSFKLRLDMI